MVMRSRANLSDGLANVVDIVRNPNAAFARLCVAPVWVLAYVIASALGMAGSLMLRSALVSAIDASARSNLLKSPAASHMLSQQQQAYISSTVSRSEYFARVSWMLVPVILFVEITLQATILTLVNLLAAGDAQFRRLFALSATVAVVGTGLYALSLGVVVLVRGGHSFSDPSAIQSVMPSLAVLAPHAHGGVRAFLTSINVFYLWSAILFGVGFRRVAADTTPAVAWSAAGLLLLLPALVASYLARPRGG